MMKHKIYIVGMGPGEEAMMTMQAYDTLLACDTIIGYQVYLKLLGEAFAEKEQLSTPMKQERERCILCFEKAREGKKVSLICSGDAGVYGMASLMYEIGESYPDCELSVVPGVTVAIAQEADLLVLDEAGSAWELDMVDKDLLRRAVLQRPAGQECVLTAHAAPQWMLDAADYVTEMKCIRHPYQKGIAARKGVEY